MLQKIQDLETRVNAIEISQVEHVKKTDSIKSDTAELLETFNALKGAWVVLNAIGKLAKPITFLIGIFGTWFVIKNGMPK
jgi:hypothetical protein